MSKNRSVRFSEADWYSPGTEVIVGGAGGIGSWLCLLLSRIECEIYLFEDDTIDETNMGGQLYRTTDINRRKDVAIYDVCREFSSMIISSERRYTETSMASPIMFSAFDNMLARKQMFENWLKQEDREIFVDGRMQLETGQVFFITKTNEDKYKAWLFDDSQIVDQPCSAKATSHSGAMIASLMVSGYNNYIANKKAGFEIKEVPFKLDYELQLLNFTIYDH